MVSSAATLILSLVPSSEAANPRPVSSLLTSRSALLKVPSSFPHRSFGLQHSTLGLESLCPSSHSVLVSRVPRLRDAGSGTRHSHHAYATTSHGLRQSHERAPRRVPVSALAIVVESSRKCRGTRDHGVQLLPNSGTHKRINRHPFYAATNGTHHAAYAQPCPVYQSKASPWELHHTAQPAKTLQPHNLIDASYDSALLDPATLVL